MFLLALFYIRHYFGHHNICSHNFQIKFSDVCNIITTQYTTCKNRDYFSSLFLDFNICLHLICFVYHQFSFHIYVLSRDKNAFFKTAIHHFDDKCTDIHDIYQDINCYHVNIFIVIYKFINMCIKLFVMNIEINIMTTNT